VLDFLRHSPYPIHVPDDFGVQDVLDSPHMLIGNHAEIADQVVELRDKFGISYVTVIDQSMHDFAPVVQKLAGS